MKGVIIDLTEDQRDELRQQTGVDFDRIMLYKLHEGGEEKVKGKLLVAGQPSPPISDGEVAS